MKSKPEFPDYKKLSVADLVPYARNSRTHSPQQVDKIAASIREFGFLNPIIVDGRNGIVAGHGRVMAAQKLGLSELPVIDASHLSEAQKRAYVIADNRLALDAGWDNEMLKIELQDLEADGFDLSLTGFDLGELADLFDDKPNGDDNYTRKIEAPIYEIKGEMLKPFELFDEGKANELKGRIDQHDIPDDVKLFLHKAAERHTIFDFGKIAEYYAHSSAEIQDLMEQSALVIIDFDKAIEEGFVKLSKAMAGLSGEVSDEE